MKILISDFDGTLCITHSDIIDVYANVSALDAFKKEKDEFGRNNIVIIATAREPNSIMKYINMYNIPCDYIISYIGALIWDCFNQKYIYSNYFPFETVEKIFSLLEPYSLEFEMEVFSNVPNPTKNQHIGYILHNIVDLNSNVFERMNDDIGCSLEDIIDKDNYNNATYFTRFLSDELFFINNAQNTKLKAIDFLLEHLQLKGKIYKNAEVYAIGDGLDDLDMLRKFNGYRITTSEEPLAKRYSKKIDSVKEYIDIIMK